MKKTGLILNTVLATAIVVSSCRWSDTLNNDHLKINNLFSTEGYYYHINAIVVLSCSSKFLLFKQPIRDLLALYIKI